MEHMDECAIDVDLGQGYPFKPEKGGCLFEIEQCFSLVDSVLTKS